MSCRVVSAVCPLAHGTSRFVFSILTQTVRGCMCHRKEQKQESKNQNKSRNAKKPPPFFKWFSFLLFPFLPSVFLHVCVGARRFCFSLFCLSLSGWLVVFINSFSFCSVQILMTSPAHHNHKTPKGLPPSEWPELSTRGSWVGVMVVVVIHRVLFLSWDATSPPLSHFRHDACLPPRVTRAHNSSNNKNSRKYPVSSTTPSLVP